MKNLINVTPVNNLTSAINPTVDISDPIKIERKFLASLTIDDLINNSYPSGNSIIDDAAARVKKDRELTKPVEVKEDADPETIVSDTYEVYQSSNGLFSKTFPDNNMITNDFLLETDIGTNLINDLRNTIAKYPMTQIRRDHGCFLINKVTSIVKGSVNTILRAFNDN